MTTWTVVGLVNESTGDLYVAGVFAGTQKNMDRNVDADVGGTVMDQFVGYFDAGTADDAAELARQVMKSPISRATADSDVTLTRGAVDVPVAGEVL